MKKYLVMILNYLINNKEVNYVNGNEFLPPPLSKSEEESFLIAFYNGDIEARNKLIEHNLRLVVFIARKYESDIYYLEDLVSIGTLGLIKAIQTYKIEKNIKLATYASRCIENEILMFMRKKSRMKVEVSLDEPLNIDYEGNELLLQDILTSEDDEVLKSYEDNERKVKLYEAISYLKPKEKEILNLRFGLNNNKEMTQKDVASLLGISQSYISRLEKRIIKKLKMQVNK